MIFKINSILNSVLVLVSLFSLNAATVTNFNSNLNYNPQTEVIKENNNYNQKIIQDLFVKNLDKKVNLEKIEPKETLEKVFANVKSQDLSSKNYVEKVEQTEINMENITEQDFIENPELKEVLKEHTKKATITYQPSNIISPSKPDLSPKVDTYFEALNETTGGQMIGFSSSNFPNGAKDRLINQELRFNFSTKPDESVLQNLRFYPEIQFTQVLTDDNILIVKPKYRFSTDTNYIFGSKFTTYCNTGEPDTACKGGDYWTHAFHFSTVWRAVEVIGKTVEGRDIIANFFGRQDPGMPKILLTGAVHGEEWKAGALWLFRDWLNNNPNEIRGKGKQIIIVTEVNRDGIVKNKNHRASSGNTESQVGRLNLNGVNLNRNFPVNWASCNYTHLGKPASCGTGPASEPETKAIVNLTLSEKPTHLITYHSRWPPDGMIFLGKNKSSKTQNFAKWVADRTGYPVGKYDGPEVTSGGVPGDQAVWSESIGTTSILIEATWRNNTDEGKNFPMYQALVREFTL
jgi:Zinc carboxypeptidase